MAQGEQIEKSQGMENALVAQVLLDFMFDRFNIGKDVGMGNHHAARLGGGSRGEDNLQRVVARKFRRSTRGGGVRRDRLAQRFEHQHGNGDAGGGNCAGAHYEPGADTRAANSAVEIRSIGTTTAPRSKQPQNATSHSGQFSAQRSTLSPAPMPRDSSSRAKRIASLAMRP